MEGMWQVEVAPEKEKVFRELRLYSHLIGNLTFIIHYWDRLVVL